MSLRKGTLQAKLSDLMTNNAHLMAVRHDCLHHSMEVSGVMKFYQQMATSLVSLKPKPIPQLGLPYAHGAASINLSDRGNASVQ